MSESIKYNARCFTVWMFSLGLIVIPLLSCPSALYAGQDAGEIAVQSIKPVPDFENPAVSDRQPAVFDIYSGQGPVHRIDGDEIVIDDVLYKLSSPNMASGFKVGDYVGFVKNENGKIVRIEKITKSSSN